MQCVSSVCAVCVQCVCGVCVMWSDVCVVLSDVMWCCLM